MADTELSSELYKSKVSYNVLNMSVQQDHKTSQFINKLLNSSK